MVSEELFNLVNRDIDFHGVELARGYFERLKLAQGMLLLSGWLLLPTRPLHLVRVYVNGKDVGSANVEERPDVARAFPWIGHARMAGFCFRMDGREIRQEKVMRIDVLGFDDDEPAGRMSTLFRTNLASTIPAPPAHLMHRVVLAEDEEYFRTSGLKTFGECLEILSRHQDPHRIARVLDWGCGCGRLTVHLASLPTAEVFGCDIDGSAIAWCRNNLYGCSYRQIDPWPPMPYKDEFFDLVIGHSVFTHLTREAQRLWLSELRRIITPGGFLLASTHGEWAAYFSFGEDSARLLADGVFDGSIDHTLEGIAPDGYYRGTFQTKGYTIREWSRYFEIVEYLERGATNMQDLILMRAP